LNVQKLTEKKKGYWWAVIFVFFSILPLLSKDPYLLHLMVLSFIFAIVVSSWNILFGYMKIFCFGQQAFLGIGAYASALAAINTNIPIGICIVIGALFASLSGIIIGLPVLRLKGAYVALVTLAFGEIIRTVCSNWTDLTRGPMGLTVPALIPEAGRIGYYYVILAFFSFFTFFTVKIMRSFFGYVTVAIRDSQEAAESIGINVVKYKIFAFFLSSFFTGLAGGLYAHYILILTPDVMGLPRMIEILVMGLFGGIGTLAGPIIGSFTITFLGEYLRAFGPYRLLIYGGVIMLFVLFLPGGLMARVYSLGKKLGPVYRKLFMQHVETLSASLSKNGEKR